MDTIYLIIPALFLSVILIILFIKESYIKGYVVTFKIVMSAIILFVIIASSFFTEQLDFNYYLYGSCVVYILIGFLMYLSVSSSNKEKKIKGEYFSCVEMNNYFAYLDKKNRIVDISKSFLSFLNISFEEAKGMEFPLLLIKRFSDIDINGNDYNSTNISQIFNNVKTTNKENALNITCLNIKGNQVQINLFDRPILSNSNKFLGHVIYGISKDNKMIEKTEQDLNEKTIQLEMNRKRFSTFMSISKEPAFIHNLDLNAIRANDQFVKELGFETNSISFEEFKNRIHPDDLDNYLAKINELTITKLEYHIQYRLKRQYDYIYVYEYGKKYHGPQTEILSFISEVKGIREQKNEEYGLDTIIDNSTLIRSIDSIPSTYSYFLVCFKFLNIETINKQYDRKFGDICMNQYLTEFKKVFVSDNLIFRTDGLEFFFVIYDPKKMEMFKNALKQKTITSAKANISGEDVVVQTAFGISNNQTQKNVETLISNTRNASKIALRDQNNKYYFYE